jgi:hypothetical protein
VSSTAFAGGTRSNRRSAGTTLRIEFDERKEIPLDSERTLARDDFHVPLVALDSCRLKSDRKIQS